SLAVKRCDPSRSEPSGLVRQASLSWRKLNSEPSAMRRIIFALIGIAALFFGALPAFNWFVAARARAKYPPLGNLYTVEGRAMHLYCVGTGSPTLVLEAGGGDDVLYWQ